MHWLRHEGNGAWQRNVTPYLTDGAPARVELMRRGNSSFVTGTVWIDDSYPSIGGFKIAFSGGFMPAPEVYSIDLRGRPKWEGASVIMVEDTGVNMYLDDGLYFTEGGIVGMSATEVARRYGKIKVKIF